MKFTETIKKNQLAFKLETSEESVLRLFNYYELVEKWNPRSHLVAPCTAEEFAIRHVLESLAILEFLPENANLIDVGTGAGLPSIPCLLVKPNLRATLVESNTKKAVFLREVLSQFGLQNRATILNSRFEQAAPPEAGFVASRALDKFTEKLPEIIEWARNAEKFLFFGGEKVRDKLSEIGLDFAAKLIPLSDRRYVFIVNCAKHLSETADS